jgi:hypothetical protein
MTMSREYITKTFRSMCVVVVVAVVVLYCVTTIKSYKKLLK